MKKIIITGLIFIATFAFAKKDPIIATVNGTKIKKSEFLNEYAKASKFISQEGSSKEKVLKTMIDRILGIQKAKKSKLHTNSVVKMKMEDVLYHSQISKDLEPLLKKIVVTDQDVKNYYRTHPEYRTAHILFRLPAISTDKQKKAALAQALKVYRILKKNPDKFPELANKFSQTNVAPNGGDLGFQPAVKLAPEYFKAINGKANEYISAPVATQFGLHIIRILGKRSLKEINGPLYKKIVYDTRRDRILADYFLRNRQGASIKIDKNLLK